jgi:hypothetical protein
LVSRQGAKSQRSIHGYCPREIHQFSAEQGQDYLGGLGAFARNSLQAQSTLDKGGIRVPGPLRTLPPVEISGISPFGFPRLRDERRNPACYNGRLLKTN